MLKFYEGQFDFVRVVALYSGVCKVNAAIAAQILIDMFNVDIIINSGVAGGIAPGLRIFDTVISTEICYHDVASTILTEYHPWMKSEYFMADSNMIEISKTAVNNIGLTDKVSWGRMATGETFIDNNGRKKIVDIFSPLTVDMETASIAHVCYVNAIPFLAIRCITDTAEEGADAKFRENCTKASIIAKDIVVAILDMINRKERER